MSAAAYGIAPATRICPLQGVLTLDRGNEYYSTYDMGVHWFRLVRSVSCVAGGAADLLTFGKLLLANNNGNLALAA